MNGFSLNVPEFSLADTLNCGQAFRWNEEAPGIFSGIHRGRFLRISQQGSELFFCSTAETEVQEIWRDYFDLDTDYNAFQQTFSADETLSRACQFCGGIRLLRQDPWEALCSFIISQNNNIPRIRGIVSRLCENFGEPCEGGFSFPSPQRLAECSLKDLEPLRAGFRSKYILDAAAQVSDGRVRLDLIPGLPLEEARQELIQIKGVGAKVAECALLYGFHRLDAFPVDVWIKKVLAEFYPHGFPDFITPKGVAQQYLFHYIRHCPDAGKKNPCQA